MAQKENNACFSPTAAGAARCHGAMTLYLCPGASTVLRRRSASSGPSVSRSGGASAGASNNGVCTSPSQINGFHLQASPNSSQKTGEAHDDKVKERVSYPAFVGKALCRTSAHSSRTAAYLDHVQAGQPSHVLHPLTDLERKAVALQIQREVTANAVTALRKEQLQESKLHAVHIKCLSLLLLACVAMGACMIFLRVVMVPLVLALFFTLLIEPLFWTMLSPPGIIMQVCPQALRRARQKVVGIASPTDGAKNFFSVDPSPPQNEACESGARILRTIFTRSWIIISILTSMILLAAVMTFLVYLCAQNVGSFPWKKYSQSWKLELIMKWFPHFGTDPTELKVELIIPWLLQGPLFNALDVTFSIISQGFLTTLFLAFFLANDARLGDDEVDRETIGHKIRKTARSYIRIKTLMALVVGFLSGTLYWLYDVDLYLVFSLSSFILYYIPHVGNTIAVLAPLPLVFLDPQKSWVDLFVVFIVPFLLHQVCMNLIDPKLLASSLELHPIIVLISLAFWTSVWGPVGAVLSAPLTAALRLVLLELDHPYFNPVVSLLQGKLLEEKEEDVQRTGDLQGELDDAEVIKSSPLSRLRGPRPSLDGSSPNLARFEKEHPWSTEDKMWRDASPRTPPNKVKTSYL